MDWRKENCVRSGRELTSQWWTETCGTLAFTGPARVLKDQYRHRYHLLIRLPFSTCFLFEMMSTRYRFLNSFFPPIGFNRKLAPADANWIISCSLSSPIPPPPQKKMHIFSSFREKVVQSFSIVRLKCRCQEESGFRYRCNIDRNEGKGMIVCGR